MMTFVRDHFRARYHEIPQLFGGKVFHLRKFTPKFRRYHDEKRLREIDERDKKAGGH